MMNNKSLLDKLINNTLNRNYEQESFKDYVEPSPYAIGTLDDEGMPLQPKMREMYNRVLSQSISLLILEGGTRGGKDVFGLHLWGKVLMKSLEENHLALGTSLEHAIMTILKSSKFGLENQIPNGRFERKASEGAGNRGLFSFYNIYGEKRQVHFYGNSKKTDHEKYQGFTIGTTYVNEGINQHINGINEARQRMATSKDGALLIITQNPVGNHHPLYTEFEKGYLLTNDELKFINSVRGNKQVQLKFMEFVKKEELKIQIAKNNFTKMKLEQMQKSKLEELSSIEFQSLNRDLEVIERHLLYGLEEKQKDGKVLKEEGLYSKRLTDFVKIPQKIKDNKNNKMEDATIYKIMTWKKAWENPNSVENGYNYAYYHLTMWDNLGMTEMQIKQEISKYDQSSALFKQRILGERISSDGIAFPEFSDDNILTRDVIDYEQNKNTIRIIAIDPGFNHPTGIVDAEVNIDTGEIYVLGEAKVDLSEVDISQRVYSTLDIALFEVIRKRKNREMPKVLIIDPSRPELIGHYTNLGFNVVAADNSRQSADSKEMKYGNQTQKKGLKGLQLIKAGFVRRKFWIHEDCVNLISEIRGLTIIQNQTTGDEDTIKIGDDMYDAFRYICNTSGIDTYTWERIKVLEDETMGIRENDEEKNASRKLEGKTPQERANELLKERNFKKRNGNGFTKSSNFGQNRWFN